jgi:hypothetical protein
MGFNPQRQHARSNWDYVLVASALIVCLAILAWAVFA